MTLAYAVVDATIWHVPGTQILTVLEIWGEVLDTCIAELADIKTLFVEVFPFLNLDQNFFFL